ncbi:MAG: bacterioferritin-associated ferredoxin [Bermanella sp.]|jgi:bacterioferritin-associated ferredoxin
MIDKNYRLQRQKIVSKNIVINNHSHYHYPLHQPLYRCLTMYVCICNGVTDRDIHRAMDSGDRNFRQVSRSLGLASQCGSCEELARDIIKDYTLEASHQAAFYAAV